MVKKIHLPGFIQVLMLLFFCVGCGGGGGGGATEQGAEDGSIVGKGLVPEFSISPVGGNAPLNAYFDASASAATGESIVEYAWDFGDGVTGSGMQIFHVYTLEGTYKVVLTVTGSVSGAASVVKDIVVNPSPAASSVGGKIVISSGNLMDTDTNDPNFPAKENNSFETAQQISSPATLGGYVNEPLGGAMGTSFVQGDRSDIFVVSFTGNEIISLSFADSLMNDLDLYLYNEFFEIVDSSKDVVGIETLKVNGPGTYYIRVYAYSGASAYVLTLGSDLVPISNSQMLLSQTFMPGEAIVGFKQSKAGADALYVQEAHGPVPPVLLRLDGSSAYSINSLASQVEEKMSDTAVLIPGAPESLVEKDRTLNLLKALKRRADVDYAEPNFIRRPSVITPSDPYYVRQWNYPLINLPNAWGTTTGDSDVIVAVMDTGVLLDHPDMVDRVTPGYDFISSPDNGLDGDGIDYDPDDPGDQGNGTTSSFHGTHVAGTIGAVTNNSLGVAGISWNSMIMPLRVIGRDGGTSYDIIQALRYAAGLENDSGTLPRQPADIINMSFGSTGYSQAEQNTINTLTGMGTILVAAAGNDSSSQPVYPAAYSGVVAVGAVTLEKKAAWYTNHGSWIDISAPGGDSSTDINGDGFPDGVLSTGGDDASESIRFLYTFLQGTSMAAPHVSGVFALMKSIYPGLDTNTVTDLIKEMRLTDDTGSPGRDDFHGNGLVNSQKCLYAAIELAQGVQTPDLPILAATPGAINFGAAANTMTLTTVNGGDGDLWMDEPVSSLFWLTITNDNTDAANLGTYLVSVDRSLLNENTSYSGTITLSSTANTLAIPVTVYQPSQSSPGMDLGTHYIQMINTETDQVFQVMANADNGEYPFSFTGLPAGAYRLYAGNDPDNDGYILGSWEAAGWYKTVDAPTLIYVNRDISGIEFFTGYNFAISAGSQALSSNTGRTQETKRVLQSEE